jgi:hypothetical protein
VRSPRRLGPVLAVALTCCWVACETKESVFPDTGTVRLQIVDSGLRFQDASIPGFQVATWVIESATVTAQEIDEPFDFLGVKPCDHSDNVLFSDDLARSCGGTGLVLKAGVPTTVELSVQISRLLLRRAVQPSVAPDEDTDGDLLVNRYDNCPLIPNPAQEDENEDGLGDACSMTDPFTGLEDLPDSDGDGMPDGIDNCRRVPNEAQSDAVRGADQIGDECEQFSDVPLPANLAGEAHFWITVTKEITPRASEFTLLLVDFDSMSAVICDDARTYCRLDPASVSVTVVNG